MESNTDEVGTANQSVQACYGDDTAFFKLLDDIRRRKDSRGESKEAREMPSSRSDGSSQGEASTLSAFLQRASNICEGIIAEENRSSGVGSESKSSRAENTLLESGSAWMALSAEQNKPENALLDKRPATYVRFSLLQSNMMLAVHPHPAEQGGDMCPTKVSILAVAGIRIRLCARPSISLTSAHRRACSASSTLFLRLESRGCFLLAQGSLRVAVSHPRRVISSQPAQMTARCICGI